jgi:ribosomal protein L30E
VKGTEVAETISYTAKLNTKEKRLLAYYYDGGDLNIGKVCRELHTTTWTLLSKTLPNLRAKLKPMGIKL